MPKSDALADVGEPATLLDELLDEARPKPLGFLLYQARVHGARLPASQAALKLRRHLREQLLARIDGDLLLAWEEQRAEPEPWLLVAYLEALELPNITWLEVLRSFTAKYRSRYLKSPSEILDAVIERASEEDHAAFDQLLRTLVRLEAESAALERRQESVLKQIVETMSRASGLELVLVRSQSPKEAET